MRIPARRLFCFGPTSYLSGMDWTRKLTAPLTLADGRELTTLEDAANAVQEFFAKVTESGALESTINTL